MTTTTQDKYVEDVKVLLLRKKLSITAFAKTLRRPKRHRNTISQAIHHPDYFPKVVEQINQALGIRQ